MPKRSFGFSLVELLIAITIISVLTAAGAVVYKGSSENSQDQKRLRDLNSIKQALELYRNDERSYPKLATELSPKYLTPLPTDPLASSGRQYVYAVSPSSCTTAGRSCRAYIICAKKQGDKTYEIPSGCSTLACAGTTGDCDMGVTSDEPFLIIPTPTPTPAPPPAAFPIAGLVGYWKMDEAANDTCPGGGNDEDVCDSLGANHLISINAANITNGIIGYARSFNGLNKALGVPGPSDLRLQRFTISAWVYENTINGIQAIYSYADQGNIGGPVFHTNGQGGIALTASGAGSCQTDENHFTGDRFYHLVVTYDGSNCRFYVQGMLRATKPFTQTFNYSNGWVFIGAQNLNAGFFNGTIDELGVWNRVLGLTEVQQIYNEGRGRQP